MGSLAERWSINVPAVTLPLNGMWVCLAGGYADSLIVIGPSRHEAQGYPVAFVDLYLSVFVFVNVSPSASVVSDPDRGVPIGSRRSNSHASVCCSCCCC